MVLITKRADITEYMYGNVETPIAKHLNRILFWLETVVIENERISAYTIRWSHTIFILWLVIFSITMSSYDALGIIKAETTIF